MSVKGVRQACFIQTLFIRDDGERLVLGNSAYEFKQAQKHFSANGLVSDTVDVHGGDGTLLVGQVRRASKQNFDGFVGTGGTSRLWVEELRRKFLSFFLPNQFYEVIYIFPDGSAIKRQRGYIVDAAEVKELYQVIPEYHVALNFEDVNYYSYYEDDDGDEIYSQSATIVPSNNVSGGWEWDSVGGVFDSVGGVWDGGSAGTASVNINSIVPVYPVLIVSGRTVNPTLTNLTTGTSITYRGTIASTQELRIDMLNQTALLNGTNVVRNLSGTWLNFVPGVNRINYAPQNSDAPNATINWQEVVG